MMLSKTVKKYFLIFAGTLSTALGVVGIFIPLLPTTPFLLLAAACFLKSSDRLYLALINNGILGDYIRNYSERRAVPYKTKFASITLLWLSIGYCALYVVSLIYLKVLLLVIALCVTAHLLSLKTL